MSRSVMPLQLLKLMLMMMMTLVMMDAAAVDRRKTTGGLHETIQQRQRSLSDHATGDDDGTKAESQTAHLAPGQPPQQKPRTRRASPEDTTSDENRPSAQTAETTDDSDLATKPAAASTFYQRRSTRDVHGRPRSVRNNDELHRLGAAEERLLMDGLLQLQHARRQQQKRQPQQPEADQTVFRKLSLSHGEPICIWPAINRDEHQLKSRLVSDKIPALVKKASKQLNGNTQRGRPPIDPMLLMVGIGRK